jgi:hypothetical protein
LRKAGRGSSTSPFPGTIEIDGHRVAEIRLLGGYHRPGITKAGRLSVKGVCAGRPVKVYSAHSAEQVRLRRAVQEKMLACGLHFPEIIANNDHLVAERWVNGQALARLRGKPLEDAAEKVRQFLHECATDDRLLQMARQYGQSFCYLEDYLLRRLGNWVHVREVGGFVEKWRSAYTDIVKSLPRQVSHPDLSLANLLLEEGSGRLFVVDNELLGVGGGWILDWHNSLLREMRISPLDPPDVELARFAERTWRLRQLGSALDANDFGRALRITAGADGD